MAEYWSDEPDERELGGMAERAAGCVLDRCWKPICDASCTCPPCACSRCWARDIPLRGLAAAPA